eukprot:696756-Pyramimonas_sp.AAC.1
MDVTPRATMNLSCPAPLLDVRSNTHNHVRRVRAGRLQHGALWPRGGRHLYQGRGRRRRSGEMTNNTKWPITPGYISTDAHHE